MADEQGSCFVIMGFGKKTDFETGRVLDLDKSYKNMIKPAVEAAGLKCIRADEIVHSGIIDVPMYEQLLNADVVVADLSTSNKNAFYELGVRHALRPSTTVVISEDGIKTFPFDVNHVAVRQYHHLGEDIGFDEVMRFREQLTNAIKEIRNKIPRAQDSPVYTFLQNLTPPALAAAMQATAADVANPASNDASQTHFALMQQVDEAQAASDWDTARALLSTIRKMRKDEATRRNEEAKKKNENIELPPYEEDAYLLQRLALSIYKKKFPAEAVAEKEKALKEAAGVLAELKPNISNDTETLGMWGSVHKQLWDLKQQRQDLDGAIRAYERGYFIRNDYYNGINFAFLLNVRAANATDRAEAIADFVEAKRVRKDVLQLCEQWLQNNPMPAEDKANAKAIKEYLSGWYWVKATIGEAYAGLGDEEKAKKELDEAYAKAPEAWMKEATEGQLAKLRLLLEDSPLKYIQG